MAAAGTSTGELDLAGAQALTDIVIGALADQPCPGVETIQNRVEEALVQAGHWRTARAYIVHREQHARATGASTPTPTRATAWAA
ncbi:hypothetical protein G6F35_017621 [Rhizopus arrhizus]|nr:hypothetical protein G6F35_017621 [Rhizopus arrhizus]